MKLASAAFGLAIAATAFATSPAQSRSTHDFVQAKVLPAFLPTASANNETVCWKDSYGRGVGRPIHACDPNSGNPDKSGALCYPKWLVSLSLSLSLSYSPPSPPSH